MIPLVSSGLSLWVFLAVVRLKELFVSVCLKTKSGGVLGVWIMVLAHDFTFVDLAVLFLLSTYRMSLTGPFNAVLLTMLD